LIAGGRQVSGAGEEAGADNDSTKSLKDATKCSAKENKEQKHKQEAVCEIPLLVMERLHGVSLTHYMERGSVVLPVR